MADDPKIIPDPPPASPRDVRVTPDPPPRRPVDVTVTPDPPPRAPFPVNVTLDPGPGGTFDVPVVHDPGPRSPFDVTVAPDPGPGRPFQVPVTADPPPRAPSQVGTAPDPGPRVPFDVPTFRDPAPRPPVQVGTSTDPPPRQPSDVPTSVDAPPRLPVNVAVTPDPPPRIPFNVPTFPDPPPGIVKGSRGDKPTVQQIIDVVGRFDHELGVFLDGILEINPVSINGPGAGALDPTLLASWLKDYTRAVGGPGVAKFIVEQGILYGMNPVVARIFDPTYFLKMLVPGSMGNVKTAVDVEAGVTLRTVAEGKDALLRSAVNANPLRPGGNGDNDRPDVYGPENTPVAHGHSDVGQDFTVDEMVDAAIDPVAHPFLTFDQEAGVRRFDASKYFEDRDTAGTMRVRGSVKNRAALGQELVQRREAALAKSNFINGVVRMTFPGENPDGAVYTETPDPSGFGNIDDDDARVPLCFTDLRKDPSKRAYRSVYFRPLNLTFGQAIAPEYQESSPFGRVDPVVAYMRTTRTVNLSFELHAFAPEDLEVMYNKMTWLTSMCYPSYTSDSLFQSGPVVRLRIGDAVGTSAGGLPGVIRSLNFDFADALWELKRGMKVPRSFKVQLDFLALHDGSVGIVNGAFGTFRLPPGGNAPDKDTNLAGGPTDSQVGSSPGGVTLIPNGFARFGEPVRRG